MSTVRSFVVRPSSIIFLLAFAFLLRVAFLFFAGVNSPLTGDELAYQQIAENFAAGRGLFQTNNPFFPGQILYAWQAPLYPLSLGALYEIFGSHVLVAKLSGIVVSTATVYIVYDLARLIFDSSLEPLQVRLAAFIAAFLVAIYPGLLTNAHLVLSETLFIFLLLLAFDFVARAITTNSARAWLWLVGVGAAWGLATLTRGITLYFTPLLALWIGWVWWRNTKNGGLLRALAAAALLMAIAALVIAPWAARNYFQFHQFVLLETKGGVNLWLGNSPYTPNDFIRNVWKIGVREPMLNGLPNDEVARDRAAYALALNYMRAAPLTFLSRVPIKFADFWGMERNLIDVADATTRGQGWNSPQKAAIDLVALLVYVLLILCGAAGFVFAPNDEWKILFGGFTLYFLSIHLVIFGDGRFHLPLIPFFALYAAWMLVMFRRVTYSLPRLALTLFLMLLFVSVWAREMWAAYQILRG